MNPNARSYSAISSPLVLRPRSLQSVAEKVSSASCTKSRPGPTYIPERFEVIVPSTPDSLPPAAHFNESPYEEVPPARAQKAVNELTAAIARTEAGISRVVTMREQQAGFVTHQLRLLDELKDEYANLSVDVEMKVKELQEIEDEISKLQANDERSSRKRTRGAWTQTLQQTLRPKRARIL